MSEMLKFGNTSDPSEDFIETVFPKKKVKNWLNAEQFVKEVEFNLQPSVTVPDQSMSIPEILRRYSKGLPIGGSRDPIFDEEDDLPNPQTLDLSERQELAQNYAQELESIRLKDEAQKRENLSKKAKYEARIKAALEKMEADEASSGTNTP